MENKIEEHDAMVKNAALRAAREYEDKLARRFLRIFTACIAAIAIFGSIACMRTYYVQSLKAAMPVQGSVTVSVTETEDDSAVGMDSNGNRYTLYGQDSGIGSQIRSGSTIKAEYTQLIKKSADEFIIEVKDWQYTK